jgi:hypothetical protein
VGYTKGGRVGMLLGLAASTSAGPVAYMRGRSCSVSLTGLGALAGGASPGVSTGRPLEVAVVVVGGGSGSSSGKIVSNGKDRAGCALLR